ncbi:proton-coupled zinc antiporter SLC30A1 [Genypterus blacodes]|uniref:proton-coupled zinc antiporter SLC30A1 n=1 Tax=Genypterus blacodes TaxID=154954 RepID=UPI003F763638
MSVWHRCMLGVTLLLLLCQVIIGQLCKSLITMMDGFHTLFILMQMACPAAKPQLSSSSPSSEPPDTSSSSSAPPSSPPVNLKPPAIIPAPLPPPPLPPSPLLCGLVYSEVRIQALWALVSALLLAALCISYSLEILKATNHPHLTKRPLLVVAVGAFSLLLKLLIFGLSWGLLPCGDAASSRRHVNGQVSEGPRADQGCELGDVNKVQSAVDHLHHNRTLILCNPGASSVPDALDPQPEEETAAPRDACSSACVWCVDGLGSDRLFCFADAHVCPFSLSDRPTCLPSLLSVSQAFVSSVLALTKSLLVALLSPQCEQPSQTCSFLPYVDAVLCLLAVVVLLSKALPQVYRYGLLVMQATPPQLCVCDIRQRISSVPGVQAVHELHIWQLADSITVASVHVHCLPTHRFPDVLSKVTQVLQRAGVMCSTVQPEFAPISATPSSGRDIHKETPTLPDPVDCSLACGKACVDDLCCATAAEETTKLLAPPAGETRMIIENTSVTQNLSQRNEELKVQ